MLLASCGGGTSGDGSNPFSGPAVGVESAESDPFSVDSFGGNVVLINDALRDQHGQASNLVIVYAVARGYSYSQILDASLSATLDEIGLISSGVVPEYESSVLIDLPSAVEGLARSRELAATPSRDGDTIVTRLRQAVADDARLGNSADTQEDLDRLLGLWVISLARSGYDLEQITDLMILGIGRHQLQYRCSSIVMPGDAFVVLRPARVDLRCFDEISDGGANRLVDSLDGPDAQGSADTNESASPEIPAAGVARYVGSLDGVLLEDPESSIVVIISAEGTISGQLTATEQLERGVSGNSCPSTVAWFGDLSTLDFVGTPPDSGTVTGTITVVWDTTPRGCGEPSSTTTTFGIEATVSPDGAQITAPVPIDLVRAEVEE